MKLIFLSGKHSIFRTSIFDVEVRAPVSFALGHCGLEHPGSYDLVYTELCPVNSKPQDILNEYGRGRSLRIGSGFSAECTSGDWRGYIGHYIVESLRFVNENAYITLRHVGPTLEEVRTSLEGLKKDNPDNERIQSITLSEFAKTEVELEWFDTHKITLEADYEQQ